MGDPVAVGIDIGGTKLVAALVGADGEVVDRERHETPAPRGSDVGGEALVDAVAGIADGLDASLPVGVGVAGLVSREGQLTYSPNLSVREFPLGARLRERLGRLVVVGNDASVAGVAEHRVGAGRGSDDVLMVTIGTGVGGAVISGGRSVQGTNGYASEVGHLVVDAHGAICSCGNRGCIEAMASGTAMARIARDGLADRDVESSLRDVGRVTGKRVARAAHGGDAYAQRVIAEAGGWLGIGLAGLVNVLDPAIVVVGGGATTGAASWLLPATRDAMRAHVMGAAHRHLPDVVEAELGDDAGLIGAALLAARADEETR